MTTKTTFTYHRVSQPPHVLVRELGGESVLLNLETESYHGLDEVGHHMWTALLAGPDLAAAFSALCAFYDAPPEVLARDMDAFVTQLVALGLLLGHDA